MKVVMLYHPESEYARHVEEYAHDFEKQFGKTLELQSLETREGADLAKLYDITQYPALLAIDNQGQLHKDWQGPELPLMNEVSYFATVAANG